MLVSHTLMTTHNATHTPFQEDSLSFPMHLDSFVFLLLEPTLLGSLILCQRFPIHVKSWKVNFSLRQLEMLYSQLTKLRDRSLKHLSK
jgi:hypothetical protein